MTSELTAAERVAIRIRSPQLASAFWRGFDAGQENPVHFACPYRSGPYYAAWMNGWRHAASHAGETP